jgi:hypothetical protein
VEKAFVVESVEESSGDVLRCFLRGGEVLAKKDLKSPPPPTFATVVFFTCPETATEARFVALTCLSLVLVRESEVGGVDPLSLSFPFFAREFDSSSTAASHSEFRVDEIVFESREFRSGEEEDEVLE